MSKVRPLVLALCVVLLGAAGALPAAAQTPTPGAAAQPFAAMLAGCAVTPPVSTQAQGAALFQLSPDGNTMSYAITVFDINNVSEAHIHQGARGQAGPIVVWLFPSPTDQTPQTGTGLANGLLVGGTFTANDLVGPLAGKSLADLVQLIRSNNAYTNVHTTANPGGEIRGQIAPVTPEPCTTAGGAGASPTAPAPGTIPPTVAPRPRTTSLPSTVAPRPRATHHPEGPHH